MTNYCKICGDSIPDKRFVCFKMLCENRWAERWDKEHGATARV